MISDGIFSKSHECANSRWRSIKERDFIFVYDLPIAIGTWKGWDTFKHDHGSPTDERPINEITVASDPANISFAEINVIWFEIKERLKGEGSEESISSRRVENPFGFSG